MTAAFGGLRSIPDPTSNTPASSLVKLLTPVCSGDAGDTRPQADIECAALRTGRQRAWWNRRYEADNESRSFRFDDAVS